jgi:hypothetical protein
LQALFHRLARRPTDADGKQLSVQALMHTAGLNAEVCAESIQRVKVRMSAAEELLPLTAPNNVAPVASDPLLTNSSRSSPVLDSCVPPRTNAWAGVVKTT